MTTRRAIIITSLIVLLASAGFWVQKERDFRNPQPSSSNRLSRKLHNYQKVNGLRDKMKRSVGFVDESVIGRICGINGYEMARVRAIRRRTLNALTTFWTADEHGLAFFETMKPFKYMNPAHGDRLHRFTKGARIDDLGEQPIEQIHPVFQIGCVGATGLPAWRNSSAIGSCGPKTRRTSSIGT